MKELFKNKAFVRYFIADNIGKIADNYFFVFLAWLALQQTGSPAMVGALLMANAIPRLILLLVGGNIADKIAPQVILRVGNIAQAAGLALILIGMLSGGVPILSLFIIAIVFGMVDAFSLPASISAIPRIVPKSLLLKANSLVQGTEMASFTAGVLVAGLVLQFDNLVVATIINLVLYVGAALLFFTVKLKFHSDENDEESGHSEIKRIKTGLIYTWKNPVLRANIILMASTNLAMSGPVSIGFLLLVTDKLALGPAMYTILFAGFGIGVLIGAVLAGFLRQVNHPGRLVVFDYIISGIAFISFGIIANYSLLLIVCVAVGILGGVASTVVATWTQLHTKPSMLGRVGSVTMIAMFAFDPISQGATGFVAEWSIEGLFIASGLFILAMTVLVVWFNPIFLRRESLVLKQQDIPPVI